MKKIRITHVITGLSTGGAENVLRQLVARMDPRAFSNGVISLTDLGFIARQIEGAGVEVSAVGFSRKPLRGPLFRLIGEIRRRQPHIVQTWMYHADIIGGLTARLFAKVPVVWNLRQSTFDPQSSKEMTIRAAKLCARLSNTLPHAIVCGSNAAYDSHIAFGYSVDRMVVLPNGFDTTAFMPDPTRRPVVMRELSLSEDAVLIGMVARFDPQKDHQTFFAAAAQVARHLPQARFVLCGEGIDNGNAELHALIDTYGLGGWTCLLGLREDLASFYPALDVLTLSSSYGEGAPNAIGEAMACGVPCVATDIGDSALMVSTTGIVVPRRDPKLLAEALCRLAVMPHAQRSRLGAMARSRIVDSYPIGRMVERYEDLYRRVYSQYFS